MIRSKFAATELGIRDKLAVIILGQSSLSVALSALIAVHVPRVQIFVDVSRIDQEMSTMANLVPFRQNGQHSHISVLNSILNLVGPFNIFFEKLLILVLVLEPFRQVIQFALCILCCVL